MTDSTPGWQPDPSGKHDHRYWDGSQWTDNVSDGGVASTDPYVAGDVAGDAGGDAAGDATVVDTPAVAASDQPAPDATAAWPAAGAGAAAPPPYVPPSPVAGGGDGGDDGSKRKLLIGGGILAVVAVAVAAFLLLGGDDDSSNVETQLASRIFEESDGELTRDQADCVAGIFVDEIGEDELRDVDFDADEPPPELAEAFTTVGFQAFDECEIDSGLTGGDDGGTDDTSDDGGDDGSTDDEGSYGSDPELDALYDDCEAGDFDACDDLYTTSPFGSEYEDFGSTCGGIADDQFGSCAATDGGEDASGDGFTDGGVDELPGNFEEILADTYETSLGLDRDKAECLAARLAEDIESGELAEEEAFSEVMSYLSDCDISMEEIGAN